MRLESKVIYQHGADFITEAIMFNSILIMPFFVSIKFMCMRYTIF